jgi:hypothetical protein
MLAAIPGFIVGWKKLAIWIYASQMVGSTTDGNKESYTMYLSAKSHLTTLVGFIWLEMD